MNKTAVDIALQHNPEDIRLLKNQNSILKALLQRYKDDEIKEE